MTGLLLPALMCAACALALAFTPANTRLISGFALVAGTILAVLLAAPQDAGSVGGLAACLVIAWSATATWWAGGMPHYLAAMLALNSGFLAGATSGANDLSSLALQVVGIAAGGALLAYCGAWAVRRGWGLGLRVVAGWLVAVAILAAALPMVTTPGYVADHRA